MVFARIFVKGINTVTWEASGLGMKVERYTLLMIGELL